MHELSEYEKTVLMALVRLREVVDEKLREVVAERNQVAEAIDELAARCARERGLELGEGERLQFAQPAGPEGPIVIEIVKQEVNDGESPVDA
jgi:hypothetical protein